MTACAQPGCTGMIVDGYCDVCGSPAGAVPFVPDPGAADAQKVDGEEQELAEHQPDGAQDYRTRVEEAQLPDDVRKAALGELGNLERTSDQSPASAEIRTWLDTILGLPWSTEATESIDIQESREVEGTLRRLMEPTVVDVEEGDTTEAEPVAVDLEEGDTTEAEPVAVDLDEGDTREVEPVTVHTQELDTEKADTAPAGSPVPTSAEKKRLGSVALAATALAALLIGALLFGASTDGGVTGQSVPAVTATATATVSKPMSEPSDESTDAGGTDPTIQLENLAPSAKPFETVRIQGMYRGGGDTLLRVQRWEGGRWLSFPLPTKTDQSGQFTAYIELGQPGRYRLRVLDPDSGATSKPFLVVIKG